MSEGNETKRVKPSFEEEGGDKSVSENEELPAAPKPSATTAAEKKKKDMVELRIHPNMKISEQYTRTRHGNLRCFPNCNLPHKPRSFCGVSMYVILNAASKAVEVIDYEVFGSFRHVGGKKVFEAGDSTNFLRAATDHDESHLYGYQRDVLPNGDLLYEIRPSRKWVYFISKRAAIGKGGKDAFVPTGTVGRLKVPQSSKLEEIMKASATETAAAVGTSKEEEAGKEGSDSGGEEDAELPLETEETITAWFGPQNKHVFSCYLLDIRKGKCIATVDSEPFGIIQAWKTGSEGKAGKAKHSASKSQQQVMGNLVYAPPQQGMCFTPKSFLSNKH